MYKTINQAALAQSSAWQVPRYESVFWTGKQKSYCVIIPVINEGVRIKKLLEKMQAFKIAERADIIIVDGGSDDGSLSRTTLEQLCVRALLVKKGGGGLSAQLRCAYSFALQAGYDGVITIDGNNKDCPGAIPNFIDALAQGVDFVQGSRYIPGGIAVNTPKIRDIAIRFIHAPILRFFSGFYWTDTTQGFRAYSRALLLDENLAIFRDRFQNYELLAYLSYRAPRLGYRCIELPTKRTYPNGAVPTKISAIKGNWQVLKVLMLTCCRRYNS